jgi:D,D-heptose 1,7-bisphosphate phosphatase
MSKAIFLDRDGTLNDEVDYLRRKEEIKIFPGAVESLKKFKELGFLNIIITNQSGIARGFITESGLKEIHDEFLKLLTVDNYNLIDDIFYCPFHPDGVIEEFKISSKDRKPGTGMLRKAIDKYKISIEESYFIGDSYSDMKCAGDAGIKSILVKTGYGERDLQKCINENLNLEYIADDIYSASLYIEKEINSKTTDDIK